jgi:ataxia telangiectasia mutated family protein
LQEANVVYTILEVLKYDPLHSWSVDPQKLIRIQPTRETSVIEEEMDDDMLPYLISKQGIRSRDLKSNREAERALLGVRRKLDAHVNVACQVNDLIQEATNIYNLASMFPGWQPWL